MVSPVIGSASMLGLGRRLGETIAVMIILTTLFPDRVRSPIFAGGETFASKIANNVPSSIVRPATCSTPAWCCSCRPSPNAVARIIVEKEPEVGDRDMSIVDHRRRHSRFFRRPSGLRTIKNALALCLRDPCRRARGDPAGLGALHGDHQGYRVGDQPEWWLQSQRGITPRREGGGAYHAIVGTIEIGLICTAIAVLIAVLGAILLIEYAGGKVARVVSFTVDILSGISTTVAALIIYAFFITILGFGRSAIAVSMALVL